MVGEEGGGEEVAKKRRSEPPTTHLTKRMESTKRSQPVTAMSGEWNQDLHRWSKGHSSLASTSSISPPSAAVRNHSLNISS